MSVTLVIQHAKHMRPFFLLSVTCVTLPYFSTYLVNGTIFRDKVPYFSIDNARVIYAKKV